MCILARLLLCLILTAVADAAEDPGSVIARDEAYPEQYRLPSGLTITFLTHDEGLALYADVFKTLELPGWSLHGYFADRDATHAPDIFVVVDDPSIYTIAYVTQLAQMLVEVNTVGAKPLHVYMPMNFGSSAWFEAGVLDHELSHYGDRTVWRGHQAALIHYLFPSTSAEPTGQPAQNPWQTIDLWWPEAMTHKGFDKQVYR